MSKPQTKAELFEFYSETLKPLYAAIQSENVLPPEVQFEIHAALDHLSREYVFGENEKAVIEKAYSHFKRACLDVFKLKVKDAIDYYRELKKLDLSVLDNGKFEGEMRRLIHEIKDEAREARCKEGDTRGDDDEAIKAFELWEPVYAKCVKFEKEFYQHPELDWARKKAAWFSWRSIGLGALVGGVIGWIIGRMMDSLFPPSGI